MNEALPIADFRLPILDLRHPQKSAIGKWEIDNE